MNTCDLVLHYHTEGNDHYRIDCECNFKGDEFDKVHVLKEVFRALKINEHGNEVNIVMLALEAAAKKWEEQA